MKWKSNEKKMSTRWRFSFMSSISLLDVAIQQMVERTCAEFRWCRTSQVQDFAEYMEAATMIKQDWFLAQIWRPMEIMVSWHLFFITFEESQQEHGRRWVMLGAPNPSLYMSFKVWISYSPLQNDRKESTPHVIWTPNLSIFGFLRLFKITFKIFAPTTVAYTIFSYTKNGYVRVSIAFICKYFVYKTVVCAKMEEDGTW